MLCRLLFFFVLAGAFATGAMAKLPPLTVKDVSLMLRSGYAVEAVQNDLALRHFLGPIDAAAEKQLSQAGAPAGLIADLKTERYAVPAEELLAVQKEMEAMAQRRAALAEEAKKSSTLYQDQLARSRAAAATAPVTSSGAAAGMIKGNLVTSRNGILHAYNDQALDRKKLIGLYFAARWCPSCRKFTPELVEYYNRVAAAHPEFEIVFVSNDRSASAMEAYMRDSQMPWPAVAYDKIAEKTALQRYAGDGIPCLVVIDAQGRVVSDSFDGKTYRGPQRVMADLDQIFAGGAKSAVAQSR